MSAIKAINTDPVSEKLDEEGRRGTVSTIIS